MAQRTGPPGVEAIHDLGPAAERRERIAAADDLAERRQVRPDAEHALGPVRSDPEGDDLVEDQDRPDPIGVVAEEAQERRVGRADAAGALNRLDDDRGDVALAAIQRGLHAVGVVPRQLDDEAGDPIWHAGRSGERRVVGPVVGPRELGEERPAGERAGRSDGEHRRLGAGVREPDPLDRRQPAPDLLGQLDLDLRRRGERGAAPDLGLDRRDDIGVGVAEDQRRVIAEEVAVLVAVDVPCPQALAASHVRRVGRVEDRRPGRSARNRGGRPLEQGARARRPGEVGVDQRHVGSVAQPITRRKRSNPPVSSSGPRRRP